MKDNNNTASLGWGTRVAYGLGDTACNVVFGMITALLTLFYTDYCGISVVTVGMVMLISRIFDGSSDVIMGIIVNKTQSKWGNARPWILWMSVPYVLCAVAMFCVPHTSSTTIQFWYIFVTCNLCATVCYTAINVPYGTLSLIGCILVVVAHALIMVNPLSFQWILVMTIIRSLGQAPLTSLVFGMMGDVVEYGQWKSHLRQESLIFGGGSLGFKIGTGITSAVMTAMLESAGFLSSVTGGAMQPTSAQQMISSIFKFGPIFVWAVATIVLLFYKLDKIYPTIAKELAEREARGEM